MASEEQLKSLRRGAKAWNTWRRENPHTRANLSQLDLRSADLVNANLVGADLSRSWLSGADLRMAAVGYTIFARMDLRNVKGLEEVRHIQPSTIGVDTIEASRGEIPEASCGDAVSRLPSSRPRGRSSSTPSSSAPASSAIPTPTRGSRSVSTPTCRPAVSAVGSPQRI
ncbi:hypothetical protein CMK11_04280 [Candidatus Poribacteria bacterium]|nr:hypothetical protein [Candidatus Poribacteria bacterium]